ncbi:hypothetical protein [Streptomyces bambusae]|nr:hypothetical protein [Streptomyces bambusae]
MTPNTPLELAAGTGPPGPVWLHLVLLTLALGVLVRSLTSGR